MKRLFITLAVVALAVDAWAWKPLFVGHRGCNIGVENTAEAFRNGVDVYGYDGLECDVRVTKDGFYVISHDETTNRVGGNLTVADATLAELQAEVYTQTRGGVTYTGHICTVDEYLTICIEKGVFPVIELKWTTGINNNDMLRATSKQMEDELSDYPMIVRCHRAFLVNLGQVEKIISNSGAMQLSIKHCDESIPVSRSNMPHVKKAING